MVQAHVLFFDGHCGLCRSIVHLIQRFNHVKPLHCVNIHDDETLRRFPQVDRQKAMQSVLLLEPDGRQRFGYDAVAAVISLLRGMRLVHWFMRLIIIKHIGRLIYKWVSKHRYAISRWLGLE